MPRENKYTAIILKKQPFKEGDEIITFFTKQQGKLRCLAKAVKKSLSKLQQRLQALFLVELITTSGHFPKIIGVEPIKVYAYMRENLSALKRAFYALELVLKFTADEQKNEALFNLLGDFLEFLNTAQTEEIFSLGLAKFKIELLQSIGLGVLSPRIFEPKNEIFFSASKGGFFQTKSADVFPVPKGAYEIFLELKNANFKTLNSIGNNKQHEQLQSLLSQFIEYQLERKVRSEKYLKM